MSHRTNATTRSRLRKAAVFNLVRGAANTVGVVLINAAAWWIQHH